MTRQKLMCTLCVSLFGCIAAGVTAQEKTAAVGLTADRPASGLTESSTSRRSDMKISDYRLGAGGAIRILVFQNPDLTLDTRVNESGSITYPLVGSVQVGGVTIAEAERNIAAALRSGGFVQKPQVNIVVMQVRGNQVSVLGQVHRPGRFPLETFNSRLSEVLAMAGGVVNGVGPSGGGADTVILVGTRNGEPFRREIDVAELFLANRLENDVEIAAGDVLYVPPAPVYYIYGEAQRSGSYRIKRGMSIQQAIAEAGGPTLRGTERGLRVDRRSADGKVASVYPSVKDAVQSDDVLYVRESLF